MSLPMPGDVLRGRPVVHRIAVPLDDLAVRLEAAVSDDGNGVVAFGYHDAGGLEGLVGIAGDLLAGGFGAFAGGFQVALIDQVIHESPSRS